VNDWPSALLVTAERLARTHAPEPATSARFAPVAARLGLRDGVVRLAGDLENAGDDWLGDAAQAYALIGDRGAVDRLRERTRREVAADPFGLQARTFAAAYQRLDDMAEADRLVATVDSKARPAALALLIHEATEAGQQERAAALARTLAAGSVPADDPLPVVLALTAARGDRETAAVTAPVAERLAATLGEEIRDEAMVGVARLWLAAGRPQEALRIARAVAARAQRDFSSRWYADLARVLVDAGDEAAGTALFERLVDWFERQRSASGPARAARALVEWGRGEDARHLARQVEEQLDAMDDADRSMEARRILADVYLSLGDAAAAIRTAVRLTPEDAVVDALLAIADYGRAHGVPSSPAITRAIEAVRL
jgi:tetratricopeptide (TPR) repeat protein